MALSGYTALYAYEWYMEVAGCCMAEGEKAVDLEILYAQDIERQKEC
jgi:hypothetical protein